jgi:hypothetical protein
MACESDRTLIYFRDNHKTGIISTVSDKITHPKLRTNSSDNIKKIIKKLQIN